MIRFTLSKSTHARGYDEKDGQRSQRRRRQVMKKPAMDRLEAVKRDGETAVPLGLVLHGTVVGEDVILLEDDRWGSGLFISRWCPHRQADLGEGMITDQGYIKCPMHGCTFSLEDGAGINCRAYSIAVYDVAESGTEIELVRRQTEELF